MRNSIILVFAFCMLFTIANAKVVVEQNGQKVKYEQGSVVAVDGTQDTTVNYDGVKIFVPQGVKLAVSKTAGGKVLVNGENLNGVKLGKANMSSTGSTAFTVDPKTMDITVTKGIVNVASSTGEPVSYKAGSKVSAKTGVKPGEAAPAAAVTDADVPLFVTDALTPSVVSQQATQNIEEEKVLSPSSPI